MEIYVAGENKKPFTGDNHHGLLQYKNGLLRQNLVNWSTTINSGHFPADQEQKLANSGQNKQNLVYITKKMVCLTNMILASRAIWRMGEYPLGLHKDSHGFIYTPGFISAWPDTILWLLQKRAGALCLNKRSDTRGYTRDNIPSNSWLGFLP